MLRFRRDRLYLGLEPDRLSLVRLTGGGLVFSAARVVDCATIPCEENATEATLVATLEQALDAPRWQGAESHLVLADRLVRYFVAERPPGARNMEEVKLAAGLRFEDIFGVSVDDWVIQLDLPPFATTQLGCALRKSFVADVINVCTVAKSPIVSITPFAISEYNRSHSAIGGKDGWFAVPGRRSVWVGQKKGNDWLSAHQYALTDDVAAEFPRLMAQEHLRASMSSTTIPPNVWLSGVLIEPETRQKLAANPALLLGAPAWKEQSTAWNTTYRLALSSVWPACA